MPEKRKKNLEPFDITDKDRAWCAFGQALELSAAVKDAFAEDGKLMGLVTKTDSLSLYRTATDIVQLADAFEDYLRLVKSIQESPEGEEE